MMSLYSARNDRIASRSQVTSVGGIRSGKCVTRIFSGAFRTAAGSLTTSVPRLDMLQHVRRGDVGHVERRILPHQHDIHAAQVDRLASLELVMRPVPARHLHLVPARANSRSSRLPPSGRDTPSFSAMCRTS